MVSLAPSYSTLQSISQHGLPSQKKTPTRDLICIPRRVAISCSYCNSIMDAFRRRKEKSLTELEEKTISWLQLWHHIGQWVSFVYLCLAPKMLVSNHIHLLRRLQRWSPHIISDSKSCDNVFKWINADSEIYRIYLPTKILPSSPRINQRMFWVMYRSSTILATWIINFITQCKKITKAWNHPRSLNVLQYLLWNQPIWVNSL